MRVHGYRQVRFGVRQGHFYPLPMALILSAIVLVAGLSISATPAAATSSGPVAAYSFDEGTGSIASDSAGDHDGTIEGAAWTANGKYGSALDFDGTDDLVSIADADDLDFASSFTLEAWVKPDTTANLRPVISKVENVEGKNSGYLLLSRGTEGKTTGYVGDSGAIKGIVGSSTLPTEAWSHLAFMSDGTTLRLYIDGEHVATTEAIRAKPTETSLEIGHWSLLNTYFNGVIDEVRLYDYALGLDQLEADRDSAIQLDQSPIAAYSFDEGTGSIASDSAGDHDGTIEGAAWTASGKYGSALDFDGTDDLVSIGDAGELDLTNSFTLEAWVRPDTLSEWSTALAKVEEAEGKPAGYWLSPNAFTGPSGNIADGSGEVRGVYDVGNTLPTEAWSHLAVTYDGAILRIYVNGQHKNSSTPPIGVGSSNADLVIGSNPLVSTYFDGVVDEVRLYEEKLGAAQLYDSSITSGPAASSSSTAAAFTFEARAATANFECSLDGATFSGCVSPKTYSGFSDGVHTFRVRATNGGGLKDQTPAARRFIVDTNAPQTTIDSSTPFLVENVIPAVEFSANEAEATFKCTLDEEPSAPCESPFQLPNLRQGSHSFSVAAIDPAGHIDESPASWSFLFDQKLPSPIAAYSFDEGTGSIASDSAGDHDGTIEGAAWTANGKYGSALDFDGTDDLVSIADADDLDLTSAFTLEAWVRPDALTAGPTIIKAENTETGLSGYGLSARFFGYPTGHTINAGTTKSVSAAAAVPAEAWSHLALASDGTTASLYVDGQLAASGPAIPLKATQASLLLGRNPILNYWFDGVIDEVRIYDEKLDQDDIERDLARMIGAAQAPVAAYSFDEGAGTTLYDSAGNHDGTIEGATWVEGGKYGSALSFDGEDDLVSIADAADLDLTGDFTLQAWIRPENDFAKSRSVISKGQAPGGDISGYGLSLAQTTGKPQGAVANAGASKFVTGPEAVPSEAWTHLAVTSDTETLRLYVDGELAETKASLAAKATNGELWIGQGYYGFGHFKGLIDEVRIYDEMLDLGAIAETSGIGWSSATDSDVDGDGRGDLVTIDSHGTAHAFRGGPSGIVMVGGKASLSENIDRALYDGKGQYVLDVADVTGEGRADLVTLRSDGNVYIYPAASDATFEPGLAAGPVLPPVVNDVGGYEPAGVADVNGDGKADLVGIDHATMRTKVVTGQGDGRFAGVIDGPEGFDSALEDGVGNYVLDVTDVHGDGRSDLVTVYTDGQSEEPEESLLVYPGQENGEFGNPVSSEAVNPIMDDQIGEEPVGLGDVNADDRADLVTLDGSVLKLRLGKEDGTFTEAKTAYNSEINSNLTDGLGDELIGLLDFTRDGRADLVSLRENREILSYAARSDETFEAPTVQTEPISSSRFSHGGHEFAYEKPFGRRAVDPNAPKVSVSGPLVDSADGPLGVETAQVTVSASDGTGIGSSGVERLELNVDGEEASVHSVPCSPACEEPASTSFTFSRGTWGPGPHKVELKARDGVGKTASVVLAVDVPEGPSILLDGPLYARRGKTVGEATHSLAITANQSNGSVDAPRPGVKSVEVRVDGVPETNPIEQPCEVGNCSFEREWTFTPSLYEIGMHSLQVIAQDHQGNTTTKQFTITIDPGDPCADSAVIPSEGCPPTLYDLVHGWQYTGNPATDGSLLAEEWVQLGSPNARRLDAEGIVTTRGIVACEINEQGCGEVRSAPTGLEGSGSKYVVTTGVSPDDADLDHVAALRQPTIEGLDQPVTSGPIGEALRGWQDAPPSHGVTYELFETETIGESGASFRHRWWLDAATELPIRYTVVVDNTAVGGEVTYSHSFFTYDQELQEASSKPTNFFLLSEPAEPETVIEDTAEEGTMPALP